MDSDFRVKLVRVEVDHAARKKGTESSLPLNDRRVATACRLEGGSNGWPAQGTTLVPKNILGEEGPWGGERGALRAQPRHCVDRRRSSVFHHEIPCRRILNRSQGSSPLEEDVAESLRPG